MAAFNVVLAKTSPTLRVVSSAASTSSVTKEISTGGVAGIGPKDVPVEADAVDLNAYSKVDDEGEANWKGVVGG